MTKTKYFFLGILIMFILGFSFLSVQAQGLKDAFKVGDGSNDDNLDTVASIGGYGTSNAETQLEAKISIIINTVLSFLGVIFVILMIYGGFLWMTDRGNEDQVKKAKSLIEAAIIGLIIVTAAYAISTFIMLKIGIALLN